MSGTRPSEQGAAASGTPAARRGRGRWPLVMIAVVCLAPVVASYLAYYVFQRDARTNYGALVMAPAPALEGSTGDGKPFALAALKGQWVIVTAASQGCDAACAQALYATRQARTMQGRELERVVRVLALTDEAPLAAGLAAQHPDLRVLRVEARAMAAWPRGGGNIYVVDPLGNVVMAWPREPDIKALAKDLGKLLRASQIG